jgi:hypothetical protein
LSATGKDSKTLPVSFSEFEDFSNFIEVRYAAAEELKILARFLVKSLGFNSQPRTNG